MGRIGLPELILIFAIIFLLFGTSRLAGLGKGLGQAIRGFKDEVESKGGSKDEPKDDSHDDSKTQR
jgi:sec-independent protein translocase protein TatA